MTSRAGGVVVVGPVSWNTLVQLPRLPDARPQRMVASDTWSTLGGTSAGKAVHLADLGMHPLMLSTVVGEDHQGELIRDALAPLPIDVVYEVVNGRSEQHLNLMADAARVSIYTSVIAVPTGAFPATTAAALHQADHVVLDLSERARAAVPLAAEGPAVVWTDLHDYNGRSAYHQPLRDAADVVFMSDDALSDPRPLMLRMRAEGKRLVVCTRGAEGAIALDRDGWHEVAAEPAQVVDTNGAGDAFLAGFLVAWSDGHAVDAALAAGATQAVRELGSRHLSPLLGG